MRILLFFDVSTDSLVMENLKRWTNFLNYQNTIEDLSKLNPVGIISFLEEAKKQTDILLASPMPYQVNNPQTISRLLLVKTQILQCIYHANIKDSENLNAELSKLFRSYNVWLERVVEEFQNNNKEEQKLYFSF